MTACLLTIIGAFAAQSAAAQILPAKIPNPELVGQLTKGLSISPTQAVGGAGALFGLAKKNLTPGDFGKVSKAVPGIDGLMSAAPKVKPSAAAGAISSMGSMGAMLPGGLGALAGVADQFKALGLSPDMATKFLPLMSSYVSGKGGKGVADILMGAFK